jgi:O-antigen/teichoic acid export membrane protein
MSLKIKTISGILWSLGQQFIIKIIGFLIMIVLARILAPAEFGLIAMLSLFIAIGNSLMDSGLGSSLIRTNDADNRDYSTVFYFNLGGSILIYFLLYLVAPLISGFYHQPELIKVIRVYAVIIIINAFYSVQSTLLVKDMNFRLQTNIQVPAAIGGGILGIIMAKMGYGVWSLVWMSLFNSFLSTVMHWTFSKWRPDFIIDKARFKQHFNFGYKMALSGLIETIHQNLYTLIIGRLYSVTQLGLYSRADQVSQLPISNISAAISKVTFPMFSEIAQDNARLKMVYKKMMQQVIFWNAPILIYLCIVAEPLFIFLLTDKWLPAVPYFQILCLAGIIYPLHSYNLNILKVKGRSDLILKLEIIKKTMSVIGIISVIPFGIYGLLYFQLLFNCIGYYINSIYSGRSINYPATEQIADILPTLVLSAAAGLLCYFTDQFLVNFLNLNALSRILIDGIMYAGTYLMLSNLIQLTAITDFKHLILNR